MEAIILLVFVLGYLAITLEHPLRLDKTIPSLIMAALCWGLISLGNLEVFEIDQKLKALIPSEIEDLLLQHLGKTSEILIFLIGAMGIVEIIDMHQGFEILKNSIKTTSKRKLLWMLSILAFILSAVIDNLTATIVLVTLLKKLISKREVRIYYVGMIVLAANAGGAWSPIGDVTTTMLWIANKVTPLKLINYVLIPSILCMLVPTLIASFTPIFSGKLECRKENNLLQGRNSRGSLIMLYVGLTMILFVPVFKTVTQLPPYMGMIFALGVVWLIAECLKLKKDHTDSPAHKFSVHYALSKIEISSILFFLGILLSVGALESLGKLFEFASFINEKVPSQKTVVMALGFISAIIDNVPLVAASLGMFSQELNDPLWHAIAYAAGTGGSILIIGSASGIAAMGMEKIDFFWYLKKISLLSILGYLVGYAYLILI